MASRAPSRATRAPASVASSHSKATTTNTTFTTQMGAKSKTTSSRSADAEKKGKPIPKPKMFCDPTPKAYRLAEIKAKRRARDRNDPNNPVWQEEFKRHLYHIENVKPFVDTSPPIVHKGFFENTAVYHKGLIRQTRIESDNAKLLRQLAAIYNGEVKTGVDTVPSSWTKNVKNRAYHRALKTVGIMTENFQKFQSLQNAKSAYSALEMSKWYAIQQRMADRMARYPNPNAGSKVCPLPFRKVMEKSMGNPKQWAYLLVEVEDKQAENLLVELYADVCPFTVKNFQRLCTNTKATACDCRTYRCKKIDQLHSVQVMNGGFKRLYWVVGEHVDSTVEYSQMMIQETSNISHTEAGLVTRPKGRAGGTFFITVCSCPHLDQFCYVFGKIDEKGMNFLKKMEDKNTEENGQTIINMHITDCGILANPEDVPPPMLLHDFISQARLEIMPFIRRKPNDKTDWVGGQSEFTDYLKDRAREGKQKHDQATVEARSLAEFDDGGDDQDAPD